MKQSRQFSRREFLKYSAAAVSAAGLSSAAAQAAMAMSNKISDVRAGRGKPNVIYIMADDLGWGDLGCYGQKKIKTPNLDKMAAEGMRFTQHYAGSTVCAPSRNCLMTGEHTGHCYIRGNASLALADETVTAAEIFKQAGYATACIGKWGLGGEGTEGHPNNQGFDHFFGYLSQVRAHHYYTDYLWRNDTKVMLDGKTYSHDLMTAEALDFIKRNAERPFFLYLPYTIPHAELLVPQEPQLSEYQSLGWPETPYGSATSHYGYQATPHAAFAAMVTRMDADAGRIFSLLKELGIDDNTLVFFTSDNGPHAEGGGDPNFFDSNGPYRGIKRDLYEGGIREPMIARWPGKIKPGTVCDHISAFWDFLPTCAELAGVKAPSGIDGISYLLSLLGKTQKQHEYLYWEFYEGGGKQAVRKGKWKGIRLNMKNEPDPPVKLFDLEADPGENSDVSSSFPQVAAELKELMQRAHVKSPVFKFYGE